MTIDFYHVSQGSSGCIISVTRGKRGRPSINRWFVGRENKKFMAAVEAMKTSDFS